MPRLSPNGGVRGFQMTGALILWRLFLKPTNLNNKIETQADQWYCSSPSSATASVPAFPLTDQFLSVTAEAFLTLSLAFVTASEEQHVHLHLEKNNEKFEFLQMKGTIVNRQNHDSNIPSNIS